MQSARRCRVRAYLDQGVRPHINLHGVRYTNGVLATSTHLIGQHLLIYMNADDLRCVRAFLADGSMHKERGGSCRTTSIYARRFASRPASAVAARHSRQVFASPGLRPHLTRRSTHSRFKRGRFHGSTSISF
jgi:hypothetical protein